MKLDPRSPRGMLLEQAEVARAMAKSQDDLANSHDKSAEGCRAAAADYRAKAKAFEDAAQQIKTVEDDAARLAALRGNKE